MTALGDWLVEVCQRVEQYVDEAAQVTPAQASSFMGVIDAAVSQLQLLRDQLTHANHLDDTLNPAEK